EVCGDRGGAGLVQRGRVVFDRLVRTPDVVGRRVDHDGNPNLRGTASRNISAAASGAVMLTHRPVPSSKPPYTATRGTTSTHQWKGRGSSRGAVWTTTLYATSPRTARRRASASCRACVTTRISLSVARS